MTTYTTRGSKDWSDPKHNDPHRGLKAEIAAEARRTEMTTIKLDGSRSDPSAQTGSLREPVKLRKGDVLEVLTNSGRWAFSDRLTTPQKIRLARGLVDPSREGLLKWRVVRDGLVVA